MVLDASSPDNDDDDSGDDADHDDNNNNGGNNNNYGGQVIHVDNSDIVSATSLELGSTPIPASCTSQKWKAAQQVAGPISNDPPAMTPASKYYHVLVPPVLEPVCPCPIPISTALTASPVVHVIVSYPSPITCLMAVCTSVCLSVPDMTPVNIGNTHPIVHPCSPPCIGPSPFAMGALTPCAFHILNRYVVDFPIFDEAVWNDRFQLLKVQAELEYFGTILEMWI